jgi:hypothetical protein
VWGGISAEERAASAAAFHPRPPSHTAIAAAIVQRLKTSP